MMKIEADPFVNNGALAVTMTVWCPSESELSTRVRLNALETCPAGIVTLSGTVSFAGVPDTKETTRSVGKGPEMLTEAALVNTPAFSQALAGRVTIRFMLSLSSTEMAAE